VALFLDTRVWVAFLTLTVLEIVLGIDNILFLVVLVDRLPPAQRQGARVIGLLFAMLTRIALLFSVVWLAALRRPLVTVDGWSITIRDTILFAAGAFLIIQSMLEIREMLVGQEHSRRRGMAHGFVLIVLQIGIIDIVFSLDSVFTAVGLAKDIEVMVAAIVASVVVMMAVAAKVGAFIARYPTVKMLALAFLLLVGGLLIADAFAIAVPKGYLYVALAFAGIVEGLNIALRRRPGPR
jgi:predicted tellurium resistance membrane protein TerC